MAKRVNQFNHDQMVKYTANYLVNNGYRDIKADLYGFAPPAKITWQQTGTGHIPDVTARNGQLNIFEVETDDSIFDQHTADQWKLFAAYAHQKGAKFWVVVPIHYEADAQSRISQLGIQADIWGI
jgi:hypothetical protein